MVNSSAGIKQHSHQLNTVKRQRPLHHQSLRPHRSPSSTLRCQTWVNADRHHSRRCLPSMQQAVPTQMQRLRTWVLRQLMLTLSAAAMNKTRRVRRMWTRGCTTCCSGYSQAARSRSTRCICWATSSRRCGQPSVPADIWTSVQRQYPAQRVQLRLLQTSGSSHIATIAHADPSCVSHEEGITPLAAGRSGGDRSPVLRGGGGSRGLAGQRAPAAGRVD